MDWITFCKEAGIAGTLTVAGIVILLLLIKWILEQFKVELTANRDERTQYLKRLEAIDSGMREHSTRAQEFQKEVFAQHKEIIEMIGRINGYKH